MPLTTRLVHQQQADRRRLAADDRREALLALGHVVDERIGAELRDRRDHLVGRLQLACRRAAQIGARRVAVSSRSRTWPTTGGGQSSPSSASPVVCSDIRTCTRARRGAPIDVSEFSPAASMIGSSALASTVPR